MLIIDSIGANRQHKLYMDSLKNIKTGALMQRAFFEEIFPTLAQKTEFAYPYQVGIPKSLLLTNQYKEFTHRIGLAIQ